MKGIIVAHFGTNSEGITTYRVNGEKQDLLTIIKEAQDIGFKFWEKPVLERAHKHYSVLLKLYIPRDMSYPEESSEAQSG